MIKPNSLIHIEDGLKLAIREMRTNSLSSVYVVDRKRQLKGIVTIDDALKGVEEGQSMENVMTDNYETAAPDDYVQDLIAKATQSKFPIAVLKDGKLVGIIPRAAVLSSLTAEV